MSETILVTGGAGFIGSNFVRYLLGKYDDIEIVNLDKLTYAGNLENLRDVEGDSRYSFVKGDICDAALVRRTLAGADAVVNFAAETHVDRSISGPEDFIRTDVYGTFVLLEAAREAAALHRFVQISTDEVYGTVPTGASRETDELKPRNPYAASKAGADRLVNCIGGYLRFGGPLIIVDSGTATNFDIVGEDGAFEGGIIAPGVNLSMEALHKAAARLPRVAIQRPAKVIGTDTVGNMQSGIYWGYVSLIEGLIARIKMEYGRPMRVIGTGGVASLFQGATTSIDEFDPDITVRGLLEIWRRNT